jgi:mannose-6-phosphate isomerase-like protein (cupin superfamily)
VGTIAFYAEDSQDMKKALFRIVIVVLPVLVLTTAGAAQGTDAPKTGKSTGGDEKVRYLPSSDVQTCFQKGATLVPGDGRYYKVLCGKRDAQGQAELHVRDTDVFYIVDGTAVFITGGKMVNAKTTAPDEVRGDSIEGGETHQLSKGDVIVIPAGTPHWFKSVQTPPTFLYFVVKAQHP